MMKLKLFLTLMSLALSAALSYSQELTPPKRNGVSIGETKVSMGKDEIIIDYRILLGEEVRSCKVSVTMFVDGKPYWRASEFSGDVGTIRSSGVKQIRYDISRKGKLMEGRDISFRLDVSGKNILGNRKLIIASMSPLTPCSYGGMLGAVRKLGGYVSVRSNYEFGSSDFSITSSGAYHGGGYIYPTKINCVQTLMFTGGLLVRVCKFVYPYAGFGYGHNKYLFEYKSAGLGLVTDISPIGFAAETGVVSKVGPIAVSVGVSTIKFKAFSLDLGLGVMF